MHIDAVPFNEQPFGKNAKLREECRDGRKHISQWVCAVHGH